MRIPKGCNSNTTKAAQGTLTWSRAFCWITGHYAICSNILNGPIHRGIATIFKINGTAIDIFDRGTCFHHNVTALAPNSGYTTCAVTRI